MRLFMTNGMFGRCLEQIGHRFESLDEVLKEVSDWKGNKMIRKLYRVSPYDRIAFDDKTGEVAIDFGDTRTFMLVLGCSSEDFKCWKKRLDNKTYS